MELLMGNEAIALGALAAGVHVVTGYPGTPSTEVLETVARRRPEGVYGGVVGQRKSRRWKWRWGLRSLVRAPWSQ